MTELSTRGVLNAVRALLGDRTKWTQLTLARDAYGMSCDVFSPLATCWCVMGAVKRVCDGNHEAARKAIYSLIKHSPADSPVVVNDMIGHAAVLRMLDRTLLGAIDG